MTGELIPLQDILTEIGFLRTLRDRTTFEDFKASSVDVRAASYSLMIISEAARRIPEDLVTSHEYVPWHAIRAIGNKLRHEYQRVSDTILWDILVRHIDPLAVAVEAMLHQKDT